MGTSTTMLKKKTALKPPKKAAQHAASGNGNGIKKQCVKSKTACKVTFTLPKEAGRDARQVALVGDFNGWDPEAHPMKRQINGDYAITLELEAGREYQYRYLIDCSRWENDYHADRYVKSPFGDCDNSVVSL
jgi:1,4-alpha-glucan branching enzyme